MCGRYTVKTPVAELLEQFGLTAAPADQVKPRFNVAPTQEVPIIANDAPKELKLVRWGLIPFWAKDARIGSKMINARGETLAEKPAYKAAIKRKRCLVLTDGFYEWKDGPLGKTPMYIYLKSQRPFAFGGLWDTWTAPDGHTVRSCTVITTAANEFMSPIHDRMPLIIAPEDHQRWLRQDAQELDQVMPLIHPYGKDDLVAHEVSRLVNSPKNDLPDCVLPA